MRPRVVLLIVPTLWVACFSQSSGGPGTNPEFDAGFDATEFDSSTPDSETPTEAAVEAALDSTSPPAEAGPMDAGPTDASVDVATDVVEAGPAPTVVVVGGANGYESGIPILFSDASGNVVASATTDATGQVSQIVPAGGMVTVVLGTITSPRLTTYVGVTPGQLIPVADATSLPAMTPVTLGSLPAAPVDASYTYYQAFAGTCDSLEVSSVPSLTLLASPACIGFARVGASYVAAYPLLVDALDSSSHVQGYLYSTGNSPLSTDDLGQLDPSLPASWATDQLTQSLTVTGATGTPTPTFSEVVGGVLVPNRNGPGITTFTTHPSLATQVQVEAFYGGFQGSSGLIGTVVATSAPAPTTSGTVSLDGSLVAGEPTIGSPGGSVVPGGLRISWTGDLSSSTGVVAVASWKGNTDAGIQTGAWTVIGPGMSSTSLATPTLPPGLSAYAPQVAGSIGIVTVYGVDGQTAFPTYASLLPTAPLFINQTTACSETTPIAPVLPKGGTALFSMAANTPNGC
jgi:hypothetical protein